MDKLLVEVYVPILGKAYDVYLPTELHVKEAAVWLKEAIFRLNPEEQYRLEGTQQAMLCLRENGMLLRSGQCIGNCIRNGTKLLLI